MTDHFNVAIDCIIFGFDHLEEKLKLLLIKRDFQPGKGSWSLMTGFLKAEESFDEAADRILAFQTGLSNIYLEQLHAYSGKSPHPNTKSIAVAYYALINIHEHKNLSTKHSAKWFELDTRPKLIFDHDEMVAKAILRLRRRTITRPIGFRLLPKKFTMRQLLRLYEEIWGQNFDRRNFSKKVNTLGIIIKLDEKDRNSSKKGSYLFKFNKEKFIEMEKSGFTFISKKKPA